MIAHSKVRFAHSLVFTFKSKKRTNRQPAAWRAEPVRGARCPPESVAAQPEMTCLFLLSLCEGALKAYWRTHRGLCSCLEALSSHRITHGQAAGVSSISLLHVPLPTDQAVC